MLIEMAETSTMNSDNKVEQSEKMEDMEGIKTEVDVLVKREPLECVVCVTRSLDCVDIYSTTTRASGAQLSHFLNKLTHVDLAGELNCSKFMCKSCFDLVNVLEQAEIEYNKLKETFESIISKNPLFEAQMGHPIRLSTVKAEVEPDDDEDYVCDNIDDDSDDAPLATQSSKRKRHKVDKKKKKPSSTTGKRKMRNKVNSDR